MRGDEQVPSPACGGLSGPFSLKPGGTWRLRKDEGLNTVFVGAKDSLSYKGVFTKSRGPGFRHRGCMCQLPAHGPAASE